MYGMNLTLPKRSDWKFNYPPKVYDSTLCSDILANNKINFTTVQNNIYCNKTLRDKTFVLYLLHDRL